MVVNTLTYTGAAAQAPLMEKIDPYDDWLKKEGVPIIDGVYIPDMRA